MTSIADLAVTLSANTGKFTTDMGRAARQAEKDMAKMQKSISVMGLAIGDALGHLIVKGAERAYESIKRIIEQADQYGKAAQKIGIGVEAYSRLAYAANLADVSLEQLQSSVGKLVKYQASAAQGNKEAAATFAAFGIAVKDSSGHLRDTESVLKDWARVFQSLPDGPEKTALALRVFGKSGQEIIPLLNKGADGLKAMGDQAERTGNVFSEKTAKQSEILNDKIKEIEGNFHGMALQIATQLLPTLDQAAIGFEQMTEKGDAASSIADVIRLIGTEAAAAAEFIQSLITGVISLYSYAQAASKMNPLVYALNRLAGNQGPGQDLQIANDAADRGKAQLQRAFDLVGQGLNGDAGASSFVPGDNTNGSPNGRGRHGAEGAKNLAAAANLLANATEKTAKAHSHASKAAHDQAEAERELKKEVEEVARAHDDFVTKAQDLQDELDGPGAQALTKYKRDLIELTQQAQKGEISTDELAKAQANLTAIYLKEDQEIKDRLDTGKQVLADLQFQIDLTNKASQAERDRAQFLHDNPTATGAQADQAVSLHAQLDAANRGIEAADQFRGHWEDAFASLLDGTKSFKDAFNDLAQSILSDIARMLAHQWVEKLFGQFGTSGGGSGGGFFSSLLGAFTGGGSSAGALDFNTFGFGGITPPPGFAGGTDFAPGGMAWVGEDGPELVNLPRGSQVTPSNKVGAGVTQIINNNYASPVDSRTRDQVAARQGFDTRRALARNTP